MINSTLTQNDMANQLSTIEEAAEMGIFPDGAEMNAWIANTARLFKWAVTSSGTAEGDKIEARKFIDDLQARYAVTAGV